MFPIAFRIKKKEEYRALLEQQIVENQGRKEAEERLRKEREQAEEAKYSNYNPWGQPSGGLSRSLFLSLSLFLSFHLVFPRLSMQPRLDARRTQARRQRSTCSIIATCINLIIRWARRSAWRRALEGVGWCTRHQKIKSSYQRERRGTCAMYVTPIICTYILTDTTSKTCCFFSRHFDDC